MIIMLYGTSDARPIIDQAFIHSLVQGCSISSALDTTVLH